MDPIEQRVRESLRARAADAEPTPHLYRGVQDRIARRRRLKVMTWVPAGAAALGVAVAIPLLLSNEPEVPRIEDYAEEQPAGDAARDRIVIVDELGDVRLLDLADGSTLHSYRPTSDGGVEQVAVAPEDRRPVPDVHTGATDAGGGLTLGVLGAGPGEDVGGLEGLRAEGRFAVSPDGRWLATLSDAVQDADGWVLRIHPSPGTDEAEAGDHFEPGVVVPAGSVVQDWTGRVEADDTSQVSVATPDGLVVAFPLNTERSPDDRITGFGWVDEEIVHPAGRREIAAYASSHLSDDADGGRAFALETVGDGVWLQATDGDTVLGQVDVGALLADGSLPTLDAWGDAAVLVNDRGAWLLTHDGEGNFVEPVALPDGTVAAALVGRDVSAAPEVEETEPPVDPDDGATEEAPTVEALPGAVVVTDANAVVLRRADGSELDLLRYPAPPEGEGTNLAAAVRPGSTPDDLILVVARLSEGLTDLRAVEVVGGEVRDPVVFEGAYAPASATDTEAAIEGLAWTPDGAKLLWLERRTDGDVQLRSVGWDRGPGTGDPATDNAAFAMPEVFPARLVDVHDAGGGRLVARFAAEGAAVGWYRWILELQGDGALVVPGTEPERIASPVSEGGVVALAGADEESRPTTLLVFGADGPRLVLDPFGAARDVSLPSELAPGEGLPETWLHVLGDGAVVGGAGQVWFVGADGGAVSLGVAVDADPVR